MLLSKYAIERWFDMPPLLFIVRPLPWETLRPRKITSSAVKEHLFELLVFFLSITFVSHMCSQQMFKMLSVCMHAHSQSLSPLADSRVNNVLLLLQIVPDVNEAQLQLIDTVHTTIIHSVLHNTPDLIIH